MRRTATRKSAFLALATAVQFLNSKSHRNLDVRLTVNWTTGERLLNYSLLRSVCLLMIAAICFDNK